MVEMRPKKSVAQTTLSFRSAAAGAGNSRLQTLDPDITYFPHVSFSTIAFVLAFGSEEAKLYFRQLFFHV